MAGGPKSVPLIAADYPNLLHCSGGTPTPSHILLNRLSWDPTAFHSFLTSGVPGVAQNLCFELLSHIWLVFHCMGCANARHSYRLDETDSGLDVDALKAVATGVNALRGEDRSMLVITHYQRLLDYIVPDRVHVLMDGRIVRSGDASLAHELESRGYDWIAQEIAAA